MGLVFRRSNRERKSPEQPAMSTVFTETYRKSFSDWDLNIEDENPSSEPSANFNGFLGITKYTAHTTRQNKKKIKNQTNRYLLT